MELLVKGKMKNLILKLVQLIMETLLYALQVVLVVRCMFGKMVMQRHSRSFITEGLDQLLCVKLINNSSLE